MADTMGGTPSHGLELRASGLWVVYETTTGKAVYRSINRADAYARLSEFLSESGSTGCWVRES
jgi:hypothetical protein